MPVNGVTLGVFWTCVVANAGVPAEASTPAAIATAASQRREICLLEIDFRIAHPLNSSWKGAAVSVIRLSRLIGQPARTNWFCHPPRLLVRLMEFGKSAAS
jgi:hypothetical protein